MAPVIVSKQWQETVKILKMLQREMARLQNTTKEKKNHRDTQEATLHLNIHFKKEPHIVGAVLGHLREKIFSFWTLGNLTFSIVALGPDRRKPALGIMVCLSHNAEKNKKELWNIIYSRRGEFQSPNMLHSENFTNKEIWCFEFN